MLREAVSEVRGEPLPAHPEVRVDLPLSAFLPAEYIPETDERVLAYRRIAAASSIEAVESIAADLEARYGAPPSPARDLITVARIRAMAADLGIASVSLARHRLTLTPVSLSAEERGRLAAAGAVYVERTRSVHFVESAGEPPASTAIRSLGAILGAVRGP
jgi:transcription-repair coupling factor (superfamily II helicase)